MKKKMKPIIRKMLIFGVPALLLMGLVMAVFTIFFDQAVIVRRNTIYHVDANEKVVALTFDDGPSPVWTPQILDALKNGGVKATFFMLGEHVARYPDVARRVADEGHEIANHTFNHRVLLYFTPQELTAQIKDAERVISEITGKKTRYFRPPKAWITEKEKKLVKSLGYEVVLWSLNSKDWVTFDDKYIIRYIKKNIRPGDIVLFHDSGGAFSTEGGDRHETVLAVSRLIEKLKSNGYRFVTVSELLELAKDEKTR